MKAVPVTQNASNVDFKRASC